MTNSGQAIFFDLGNVLVMFDASRALKKFSKIFEVAEKDLWDELFLSDLERAYTKGEISSKEFFLSIQKKFKKPLQFQEFAHIWNDIFWANEKMEELVKNLSRSYKLYLISNTNELHFEYIKKNFSVLKYFERCFPSHEVGFRKPDAAIYRYVLEKTALKPTEVVYIDDIPEFVASAQSLGIPSVVFSSREQLDKELGKLGIRV